jgi:flagellar export protein FliJ
MKSRDAFIRLQRYKADEKRRHVDQIESMIAEFERMARDLDEQVRAEEERSGIRDIGHFAYPTFAKAAIQRRDNLFASTQELREQLRAAREECDEAVEELRKVEAIAERDHSRLPSRAPEAAA